MSNLINAPASSPHAFAGFDTWDEYLDYRQRKHERTPNQRREAEAARIIETWHRGGFTLFCELMDEAQRGGIASIEHARVLLPVFLEVVEEMKSYDAECERTQRLLKIASEEKRGKQ